MRLAGKIAIVTGAASGFGEGIARKFVAEGARVVVADRDGDGARRVAARSENLRRDTLAIGHVDIVDDDSRAFLSVAFGDPEAEPRACTGDDRNLGLESHRFRFQPCCSTTVFNVVNPYSASKPFSRPCPECLTPPNGSSTPPPAP